MNILLRSALVSFLLAAGAVQAANITVTNVSNTAVANEWYLTNFRGLSTNHSSDTIAAITGTKARNGNGSVEMAVTDGSGKADYAYKWGYADGRTLGNLNVFGFDWSRSGGNTTQLQNLMPGMRLIYDADGNMGTPEDTGYLVFEQTYNGSVLQDQWVSSDLMGAKLWQVKFSPSQQIHSYNHTLGMWASGQAPAGADILGASTKILGIEFGVGSGWNGNIQTYVDNVRIGFAGEESKTFNFELAQADVPEPASLLLMGLGALGLAAGRRRKLS